MRLVTCFAFVIGLSLLAACGDDGQTDMGMGIPDCGGKAACVNPDFSRSDGPDMAVSDLADMKQGSPLDCGGTSACVFPDFAKVD